MPVLAAVLLVAGYAVSLPILLRIRTVFRERRGRWFVAFEAAAVALVAGYLLAGRPIPAAVNATAVLVLAWLWWKTGRRIGDP